MNGLKVTDLLGLGSVSAFILTILYLYGYSAALGVNLFLYFGLNDYFRLAIEWLPPTIVSGIIGGLIHKFFARVEHGATEEEIAASSPTPRFTRRFRWLGDVSLPAVLVVVAVFDTIRALSTGAPEERLYLSWGAAGVVLWIALVSWYRREPRLVQRWTQLWSICVTILPALAILAICHGLYDGKSGKRLYTWPANAQILLKSQTTPITGRVLFLLDNYLVLRDHESGSVVAIQRTEVIKLLHAKDS